VAAISCGGDGRPVQGTPQGEPRILPPEGKPSQPCSPSTSSIVDFHTLKWAVGENWQEQDVRSLLLSTTTLLSGAWRGKGSAVKLVSIEGERVQPCGDIRGGVGDGEVEEAEGPGLCEPPALPPL